MQRVLQFLGLVGFDGNLSLTNVVVYVALVKIAMSPAASPVEWGTLVVAMVNYAHKRQVNNETKPTDVTKQELETLSAQVAEIKSGSAQQVAEIKDSVGKLSVALGVKNVGGI